jgi:hypothetical protein
MEIKIRENIRGLMHNDKGSLSRNEIFQYSYWLSYEMQDEKLAR